MDLYFLVDGHVRVTMDDDLKKIVSNFPDKIQVRVAIPAG